MLADIMVSRAQIGNNKIDLHKHAVASCCYQRFVNKILKFFG